MSCVNFVNKSAPISSMAISFNIHNFRIFVFVIVSYYKREGYFKPSVSKLKINLLDKKIARNLKIF